MVNAPVEEKVESSVAVSAPVTATVPVTFRAVPLQVKLAESDSRPDAPAKVTRVLVRAEFLIDPAVRKVPSQVKLAESDIRPDAPANGMRVFVKELTVNEPPTTVLPEDPVTVNLLVLIVMLPADTKLLAVNDVPSQVKLDEPPKTPLLLN